MVKPEFKSGDILYYVNPFIFIIDKVLIEFIDQEYSQENIYYIDHSGAYLLERNLFETLEGAKNQAQEMLDKFYIDHTKMIQRANPQLEIEPND